MKTLLGVLGCRFFLFITLNILSHSLSSDLHCCCWNNLKSVDNLMGIPCMLFVALLFFAVLGAESSLLRVGFLCLRQVRCSPVAPQHVGSSQTRDGNPCPLHWQADSQSLAPPGSPGSLSSDGWVGLCSCRVGCWAWGFPAVEPAGCWLGPGLGAEMGASRRAHTSRVPWRLHYRCACPEPQLVSCSRPLPPQETL